MMKTMMVMLATTACLFLLTGCPVSSTDNSKAAYAFIDGNGDGICDTCGQAGDGNGDGVCDNFVDVDRDGICDNQQSHARLGQGAHGFIFQDGNGDGQCDMCGGQDANGDGVCDAFVDADDDGICDNYQSHVQHGHRNALAI